MNTLLGFAAIFVVLTSIQLWIRSAIRFATATPTMPLEPRLPWGLSDILVTIALQMVIQGFAHEWFCAKYELPARIELQDLGIRASGTYVAIMAASSLAAMALSVGWLALRHRPGAADFGIRIRTLGSDLLLGVRTFVMFAPVVYGIQAVLVQLVKSEHPLIEMLKKNPSPRFFALSGFAAVIVAPLVEEFFFRVLLQGWFERLRTGRHNTRQIVLGGHATAHDRGTEAAPESSAAPNEATESELDSVQSPTSLISRWKRRWPIVASAALFALAHASNGPDPVPLFVLALGLGYLYQTTQRILPSIVVHFLLNGTTLLMMWLAMAGEQ